MKLALGYSTKDQVELTKQTIEPLLQPDKFDLYWCDGSNTDEGRVLPRRYSNVDVSYNVRGGADAAIAWKLSQLLAASQNYTHIGLIENDVLLDSDWLAPTLALFEKGKRDGLDVGMVSARSYVDRILIQRDGYAVMHNIGAGMVILTREAAEIILRYFRTHWWPDNVRLFAQLSGIDLRTYACFRGQEQFVTTDWGFEAQLARHGLATLALTPAKCDMIGQVPSLREQGLELVRLDLPGTDGQAFDRYRTNLDLIRQGKLKLDGPNKIQRQVGGMLFFPHQMGHVPEARYEGDWRLKWSQGWGPFAYRAGQGGASLTARISGSCSFLLSGGVEGATVSLTDTRSGFRAEPQLPPEQGSFIEINVPGGPVPREIVLKAGEGAIFYGVQTVDPQMIDITFKFSWDQLPEV